MCSGKFGGHFTVFRLIVLLQAAAREPDANNAQKRTKDVGLGCSGFLPKAVLMLAVEPQVSTS